MRQSTLEAEPITRELIREKAGALPARLNRAGQVAARALALIESGRPLDQLAPELAKQCELSTDDAMAALLKIVAQYGEVERG